MEKTDESYKVPNLEKGIAVLEYLSFHHLGKTLQEIKSDLTISQTTAYRILNTLVRLDYLLYSEETKRYRLSNKLLTVGFRSLNEHNLLETVLPYLRQVRDEVKETACFGVLGEKKGIFIEQAQGRHTFHFVLSPGKPFELHCSAPGKAIMAYLPDTVRDQYLAHMAFEPYNERTITVTPVVLFGFLDPRIVCLWRWFGSQPKRSCGFVSKFRWSWVISGLQNYKHKKMSHE